MPAPTRFTRPAVPRLMCPAGKAEAFFWDAALPGFGLRAYASGRRQWIAQYRDGTGRTRRAAFGDVKTVELDEARGAARKLLSKVELGADPQAERVAARKAVRVSALVDNYLADAERRLKPRSFLEVKRHLREHAKPLHGDAAALVSRFEVVKLLALIAKGSGPIAANRVSSSLSAMWSWGLRSGTIDGANPVAQVPRPGTKIVRERVLSDAELELIWKATGSEHDHDRIVRLLMLTGARREEVAGLHWPEITGPLWTLPRVRAKNALPHQVPLGPLALAQLPARQGMRALVFGRGNGGFSGWSACKRRLDARVAELRKEAFIQQHSSLPEPDEMSPMTWTLHDLRRTLSTWLNESGVEPHVVEALLNHASGAAKSGVAGVYNKALYREPKQAALARWEAHVRGLVAVSPIGAGSLATLAEAG